VTERRGPWTVSPGGLLVTVRLTPRGGRDAVEGVERLADGRAVLKVRVRATANAGEANAALVGLLARLLKLPLRDVTLIGGTTSRIKRIMIRGDACALAAALAESGGAPL
jgi:uncharacterized protein